jgi:hypothetical protein
VETYKVKGLLTSATIPTWLEMVKGNPVVRQEKTSGGVELHHADGQVWWVPDWNFDRVRAAAKVRRK